jgi:hypothetical protein
VTISDVRTSTATAAPMAMNIEGSMRVDSSYDWWK